MKKGLIVFVLVTFVLLVSVSFVSAGALQDFLDLFKPQPQLSPSKYTFLDSSGNVVPNVVPKVGYFHRFPVGTNGRVIIVDRDRNWYITNDGSTYREFNPDPAIPGDIAPEVVYWHPFGGNGGRIVMIYGNSAGNHYIYNAVEKRFKSYTPDPLVAGRKHVGYYQSLNGKQRTVQEDDKGAYFWDASVQSWDFVPVSTLTKLGLPNSKVKVAYYFSIGGKEEVHRWYENGELYYHNPDIHPFGNFVKLNTNLPSGVPDTGYYDPINNEIVVWYDGDAYTSKDGRAFTLVYGEGVDGGDLPPVSCQDGQKIGDANNDGSITLSDGLIISRVYNGELQTPSNICCLDINKDGNADLLDSQMVSDRHFNRITSDFGVCGGELEDECSAADLDGDGIVNIRDLNVFANNPVDLNGDGDIENEEEVNVISECWGYYPAINDCSVADLNTDGVVDIGDFLLFLDNPSDLDGDGVVNAGEDYNVINACWQRITNSGVSTCSDSDSGSGDYANKGRITFTGDGAIRNLPEGNYGVNSVNVISSTGVIIIFGGDRNEGMRIDEEVSSKGVNEATFIVKEITYDPTGVTRDEVQIEIKGLSDWCDGDVLNELSCSGNSDYLTNQHTCPNGCWNGRCIPETNDDGVEVCSTEACQTDAGFLECKSAWEAREVSNWELLHCLSDCKDNNNCVNQERPPVDVEECSEEHCAYNNECYSHGTTTLYDDGSFVYCDSSTSTFVAQAEGGEACSYSHQCLSQACVDSQCFEVNTVRRFFCNLLYRNIERRNWCITGVEPTDA
jgi:hypothetical protein